MHVCKHGSVCLHIPTYAYIHLFPWLCVYKCRVTLDEIRLSKNKMVMDDGCTMGSFASPKFVHVTVH